MKGFVSMCLQCGEEEVRDQDVFCSDECTQDAVEYDEAVRQQGIKFANAQYAMKKLNVVKVYKN